MEKKSVLWIAKTEQQKIHKKKIICEKKGYTKRSIFFWFFSFLYFVFLFYFCIKNILCVKRKTKSMSVGFIIIFCYADSKVHFISFFFEKTVQKWKGENKEYNNKNEILMERLFFRVDSSSSSSLLLFFFFVSFRKLVTKGVKYTFAFCHILHVRDSIERKMT